MTNNTTTATSNTTAATTHTANATRANNATNRHGRACPGHPCLLSLATASAK